MDLIIIQGNLLSCFFYIDADTGLEFHCEFIFINGDLFNQSPDKLLVVFDNGDKGTKTRK